VRHVHPVQLRFADLDLLGHVNNVRLMEFLQEARVALLRQVGRDAGRAIGDEHADYSQVVARSEVDYVRPLFLSEEPVTVSTWVERIGGSSYTLRHEVLDQQGALAARARTVLVVVGAGGTSSLPIPDDLRAALADLVEPAEGEG
jgi:YbgC/YbaW family acyl-CoA thioester hydrolase